MNGEELDSGEIPSFVEDAQEEESSSWDMSSDEEPAKAAPVEEESSSWDMSSDEVEVVGKAVASVQEGSPVLGIFPLKRWRQQSRRHQALLMMRSLVHGTCLLRLNQNLKKLKPKIQQPYTEDTPISEKKSMPK